MKYARILVASLLVAVLFAGGGISTASAQGELLPAPSVEDGDNSGEVVVSRTPVDDAQYYRIGRVAWDDYLAVTSVLGEDKWLEAFVFVDVENRGQSSHTASRLTQAALCCFIYATNASRCGEPQWSGRQRDLRPHYTSRRHATIRSMRALIVSDIHSNLEAFDAVLADADARGGYDVVWFLGDLVGYAADPGPCIERLRGLPHLAIAGNHDHAVTGKLNPDLFNGAARAAALWTTDVLSSDELAYLAALPEVRAVGEFTHVHGSLRDPVMEYLISEPAALATFALLESPFCLVGHSHYPIVWTEHQRGADVALLDETQPLMLNPGQRVIVNPGSVGQPRDGDWRASYLLYDGETGDAGALEHRRVEYDIATAQRKIRAAGLPESLADRLARGH